MYAAASEWNDGREVWAVIHSSEKAAPHLDARGALPTGWTGARDAWMAKQAEATTSGDDVDYVYEVSLAVAKLVVGYRLDSDDDERLELRDARCGTAAEALVEVLVAKLEALLQAQREMLGPTDAASSLLDDPDRGQLPG